MLQTLQADIADVMPQAIATGLFVSLCTLQAPSGNLTPSGAPDGIFADVAGLVNIPCMAAPLSNGSIQATEVKALAEIMASAPMHVLLSARYAQIENGVSSGWQAIIDGQTFDCLGAESDSQGIMTRLKVIAVKL